MLHPFKFGARSLGAIAAQVPLVASTWDPFGWPYMAARSTVAAHGKSSLFTVPTRRDRTAGVARSRSR